MSTKPTLCLDFDGVLHLYSSGWQGADVIPDPPVEGAMAFLGEATNQFKVVVYSSRSHQPGGVEAMQEWTKDHLMSALGGLEGLATFHAIDWPQDKPSAFVSIDDRALTFDGTWPDLAELRAFRPWNKR